MVQESHWLEVQVLHFNVFEALNLKAFRHAASLLEKSFLRCISSTPFFSPRAPTLLNNKHKSVRQNYLCSPPWWVRRTNTKISCPVKDKVTGEEEWQTDLKHESQERRPKSQRKQIRVVHQSHPAVCYAAWLDFPSSTRPLLPAPFTLFRRRSNPTQIRLRRALTLFGWIGIRRGLPLHLWQSFHPPLLFQ